MAPVSVGGRSRYGVRLSALPVSDASFTTPLCPEMAVESSEKGVAVPWHVRTCSFSVLLAYLSMLLRCFLHAYENANNVWPSQPCSVRASLLVWNGCTAYVGAGRTEFGRQAGLRVLPALRETTPDGGRGIPAADQPLPKRLRLAAGVRSAPAKKRGHSTRGVYENGHARMFFARV